ncbi:MAG: acetyltransferase [Coriobacteriia bacterium]|nr:acetyltransferase [Coriobacteriia bacterium]
MSLLIIGAGGHGRVVASVALAAGIEVFAFVDSNPPAETINNIPVYESLEIALAHNEFENPQFIIAIGDNKIRAIEYSHAMAAGLQPVSIIHPTAVVSESAYVAPGSFLAAQVVVNPDASVGENVIVNTAAIIEHDCVIGSHGFIAPGAILCGNVRVGAYAFVSANATLVPNVRVGEHVLIAAGAVVTKNYPDEVRLMGVPARNVPLKEGEETTGLIPVISGRHN